MKNKIIIPGIISFLCFAFILLTPKKSEALFGGDRVTCADWYSPCHGDDCFVIWRCGLCNSVSADEVTNNGKCRVNDPTN